MKEKEAKVLFDRGILEHCIEKNINGKYYEIYSDKYNGKERFKKEISKSKYYRLRDEWSRRNKMSKEKLKPLGKKCFCGHYKKDHTKYVNGGKSAKGSRYVCNKDGCNRWNYCNL